ncbi:MAG: hypothetical protein LQ340_000295 [Diploschistes diacapsis]|nr:MAG: hypothetical protein LQ340_000295 [Diploschistes diacapsis]
MDEFFDLPADARSSIDVFLPIQIHSRPISRMSVDFMNEARDSNAPERAEADGEQELVKQAYELGLRVPGAPRELLDPIDLVTHNVSTATITSSQPDSSMLQSRNSDSTRPTSFSSSERQSERKKIISTPSTTASIASPPQSIPSATPRPRPDSKLRKSIRRLSTLGRKKTGDTIELFRPSLERHNTSRTLPPRPVTADGRRSSYLPPVLPPISTVPRPVGTLLPSFSETRMTTSGRAVTNNDRPLTPPAEEKEIDPCEPDSPSTRAAKQRSLHCSRLQRLRISHLDEQSAFLASRRVAFRQMRIKHEPARQAVHEDFATNRAAALTRQAAVNADLEHRHLTAEMDLERALSVERKACSTKIKYMEAYCYGSRNRHLTSAPQSPAASQAAASAAAAGMPARTVTEDDYRKLVEQYHLRNGMDQLHTARINVLREQQAKQADRIGRKQEKELVVLEEKRDAELSKIEGEAQTDLMPLKREWATKKRRMVWRWGIKEAIERKSLEMERGEAYGELPGVKWPADEDEVSDGGGTGLEDEEVRMEASTRSDRESETGRDEESDMDVRSAAETEAPSERGAGGTDRATEGAVSVGA